MEEQERGAFRVVSWTRGVHGGAANGDRAAFALGPGGEGCFYLADAAGSGAVGEAFWTRFESAFQDAWGRALARGLAPAALRALFAQVNALLHGADGGGLCLAAGALSAEGELRFAVAGYGVHVLPLGPAGVWGGAPPEGADRFGLKLGWLAPARWEPEPRAFVDHALVGVERVVVISDGFLGDDFRDPPATLRAVDALGAACRAGPLREAAGRLLDLPDLALDGDDATVLALERR